MATKSNIALSLIVACSLVGVSSTVLGKLHDHPESHSVMDISSWQLVPMPGLMVRQEKLGEQVESTFAQSPDGLNLLDLSGIPQHLALDTLVDDPTLEPPMQNANRTTELADSSSDSELPQDQTYTGLYRNDYLVSDFQGTCDYAPSDVPVQTSALTRSKEQAIQESFECTDFHASNVLFQKLEPISPEYHQPLFVIYRLDGKDFLVPAEHAKRWSYVPSFDQPKKSDHSKLVSSAHSSDASRQMSLFLADQLEIAAKRMLAWAEALRKNESRQTGVRQVARLPEAEHME